MQPQRRPSIAVRLCAFQLIGVLVLTGVAIAVWWASSRGAEESRAAQLSASVAAGIADNPFVAAALQGADPSASLQPYAVDLMRDTGVDFVTIMSPDGIRLTHRDPGEIGRPFIGSTGAALAGGTVTETYTGTLGPSVRTVVPLVGGDGRTVGLVAAGVTLARVDRAFAAGVPLLLAVAGGMTLIGAGGAFALSRYLSRVTGGRGPEALATMFAYYESVLRSVREGLVVTDGRGNVVVYNAQAAALLGLPPAAAEMPPVAVASMSLPDGVREALASGRRAVDETIVTDDRVLLLNQQPAEHGPSGVRGRGTVTTLRDRTELERLTGELQSMRTLSLALRAQTHDHSNRLHTLVSLLELGRPDEAMEYAEAQLGASQRLADRVIGSVAEPVISALLLGKTAQAAERGIALHVEADPRLGRVRVAPDDIVTILGNLIDNAIEAAGGEEPWVEVYLGLGSEPVDGAAELVMQVSDSG